MNQGTGSPLKVRQVSCPVCKKPSLFSTANRWRPFCSPRCAGLDFGAWSNEGYRVGVGDTVDPDDPQDPSRPAH